MVRDSQDRIELDVCDSSGDWEAFLPSQAPEGAPNVSVVLCDDTWCRTAAPCSPTPSTSPHLAAAMARD